MAKMSFDDEAEPSCEANIIPLVDVLLVLLVIFMITAQTITGVPLDLPKTSSSSSTSSHHPVTISITKQGKIFLQEKEVALETLIPALQSLPEKSTDRIYLRAHNTLSYETVLTVISVLKEAHFGKIVLLTERTPSSS